jgi:hypothetical protein
VNNLIIASVINLEASIPAAVKSQKVGASHSEVKPFVVQLIFWEIAMNEKKNERKKV